MATTPSTRFASEAGDLRPIALTDLPVVGQPTNANLVFAGPSSGPAAVPSFRSLVPADFTTENANTFLAGPTSGGAATPTFRSISGLDLPLGGPNSGGYPLGLDATNKLVFAGQLDSGQFRFVSATQVGFFPYNGDLVRIAGLLYQIPSAGVLANNTSVFVNGTGGQNLAASTTYWVYVFNNSGTLTLDYRTTGHTTDTTAGNVGTEVLSTSNSRSLVGMVRTNASSQFADSGQFRQVMSWFNRRWRGIGVTFGNNTTNSINSVYVNLSGGNTNLMGNWADEQVLVNLQAQCSTSTGGAIGSYASMLNSTATILQNQFIYINLATPAPTTTIYMGLTTGADSFNAFLAAGYGSLNATASTLTVNNAALYAMTRM